MLCKILYVHCFNPLCYRQNHSRLHSCTTIHLDSTLHSLPSGRPRPPMDPCFSMLSFFSSLSLLYPSLIIQSSNICVGLPLLPSVHPSILYKTFYVECVGYMATLMH